jgi:hypothetical protein
MPINEQKAVEMIQGKIDEININFDSFTDDEVIFSEWRDSTSDYLKMIFGKDSDELREFSWISFSPSVFYISAGVDNSSLFLREKIDGLTKAMLMLKRFIKKIQDFGLPANHTPEIKNSSEKNLISDLNIHGSNVSFFSPNSKLSIDTKNQDNNKKDEGKDILKIVFGFLIDNFFKILGSIIVTTATSFLLAKITGQI